MVIRVWLCPEKPVCSLAFTLEWIFSQPSSTLQAAEPTLSAMEGLPCRDCHAQHYGLFHSNLLSASCNIIRVGQNHILFVYDHFVTKLSNNYLNFRFQFVRGSGDYFLSLRALQEGPVGN